MITQMRFNPGQLLVSKKFFDEIIEYAYILDRHSKTGSYKTLSFMMAKTFHNPVNMKVVEVNEMTLIDGFFTIQKNNAKQILSKVPKKYKESKLQIFHVDLD